MTADDEMAETVARAIKKAQSVRAFGLYDYSSYEGTSPPHVVRDERIGVVVFRNDDAEKARAEYDRLSDAFIATAVIAAVSPMIREQERERCAKVAGSYSEWCDTFGEYKNQRMAEVVSAEIAAAIRAMGDADTMAAREGNAPA